MVAFRATLELHRATATGIEVPAAVVEELGGGKRPAVTVSFAGYSYRTTVGVMGGKTLIPVSADVRKASGVAAGDELDVVVELDTAPRTVEVPADLAEALVTAGRQSDFDVLSPSQKKAHVTSVESAKAPETRARRVAKVIAELGG